jgi:hypothetical protein
VTSLQHTQPGCCRRVQMATSAPSAECCSGHIILACVASCGFRYVMTPTPLQTAGQSRGSFVSIPLSGPMTQLPDKKWQESGVRAVQQAVTQKLAGRLTNQQIPAAAHYVPAVSTPPQHPFTVRSPCMHTVCLHCLSAVSAHPAPQIHRAPVQPAARHPPLHRRLA